MAQFAAALSVHPNSFEAAAECAGAVLEQLDGNRPDLVVVACTPAHRRDFADVTAGVRKLLECDTLVATVSPDVVGAAGEAASPGTGNEFAVFAADWGGGCARALRLDAFDSGDGRRITGWPDDLPATGTLLLLADPVSFPVHDLLAICGRHAPGLDIVGALVPPLAGHAGALAIDDTVHERGAVGVLLDPTVRVRCRLALGARPLGSPFTVTRAERNVLTELAGRSPLERLREAVASCHDPGHAYPDDHEHDEAGDAAGLGGLGGLGSLGVLTRREPIERRIRVGVVVDEHRSEFGPDDFVLRDVLDADAMTGALALSDVVRPGQTVQFHLPDDRVGPPLDGAAPRAALVFAHGPGGSHTGAHATGASARDAAAITARFGPIPLVGLAGSGEIGRVRGQTFVHSGATSIACFD